MSGIGVPKKPKIETDNKSILEFKKEFNEVVDEIRKLKGSKEDKRELSPEEKDKLRREYLRAASLAKKIANCTMNDEEKESYEDKHARLSKQAESYGASVKGEIPPTTMDDVKGLDNVKAVIETFIYMLEHPEITKHYKMNGGFGLLMHGAPGTGKTMIVEAIANKMQKPLFTISPSDIFKSYVGQSEQAVKQLFQDLDACEDGAVLFVDECETIFSKRTADTKDYKAAVTNELLQKINGFGVDGSKRIMIGATNRPDSIDPAYLRHKRFSHIVNVTPPDDEAIKAIIKGKLGEKGQKGYIELEEGFTHDDIFTMLQERSFSDVGSGRSYYSSADICGIIEEACRLAIEQLIEAKAETAIPLTREMFEKAVSKIPPSISNELYKFHENFREKASKGEL